MNEQELLRSVNPSYTTGKGCLAMLLGTGDPDAAGLVKTIDLSELQNNDLMPENETTKEIVKAYMVGQDARYHVWNRIAEESGCDVIIDLPCGYLPHGLAVARMGKTYYGFDLPVVINEIEPAISEVCKTQNLANDKIHYCSVDATNYESMKRALEGIKGKICIITDGMLGLFNKSECDAVIKAVRRLLEDFSGEWYTSDVMGIELMALSYEAVMQKDPQIVRQAVASGSAAASDIDNSENPFVAWEYDRLKRYMEEQGFIVEAFPYSEKLPVLRSADSQMMERLRESYSKMVEWRLVPGEEAQKALDQDLPFEVKSSLQDGVFSVSIQGRMDTITAPELLKQFREAEDGIEKITVDVSRMAYVSSAGLRVFLIMCKKLKEKDQFELTGVRREVREILETTGFDQFLLK